MPRLSDKPLRKIHIRIYEETYQGLKRLSTDEAGINRLAREILAKFVREAEDNVRRAIDSAERELLYPHTEGKSHDEHANEAPL